MSTPNKPSFFARLLRRATGKTSRISIAQHHKPRVKPQSVNLVDDDDDLMALAKALYPERYGTDVKEPVK